MRHFYFVRSFFNSLGTHNTYHLTDENGKSYFDPPKHWYKTRVGFKTSWMVAGIIWYGVDNLTFKWLGQRIWFDLSETRKKWIGFIRTVFTLWRSTTVGGIRFSFRAAVSEAYKIHIEQQLPF